MYFVPSDRERKVCQLAAVPLGLSITASNVMTMLGNWWNSPPKNVVHRYLKIITPCVVLSEIWKARCVSKHEQRHISPSSICHQVLFQVKVAVGKKINTMEQGGNWNQVCNIAENYRTPLNRIIVS